MKKWEIAAIVVFFAVFILLLSSVEQPWHSGEQSWQPKTSKLCPDVGIAIDDVFILTFPLSIDDHLDIDFFGEYGYGSRVGSKDYEAGVGWKFVIFEMAITNKANATRTFIARRIEDENGMRYRCYHLDDTLEGTHYYYIHTYKDYVKLSPGEVAWISFAYKMPTNAVPEKFHYHIYNSDSDTWYGEILLKK